MSAYGMGLHEAGAATDEQELVGRIAGGIIATCGLIPLVIRHYKERNRYDELHAEETTD